MGTARGYTGQYSDPLTGLDYYVSRYYDPVAGIFLSADTKEGNAQGMNPYAYVAQNPETLTDPSGQMVGCPGCGDNGDGGSGNNNGGSGNNGNTGSNGYNAPTPPTGSGQPKNGWLYPLLRNFLYYWMRNVQQYGGTMVVPSPILDGMIAYYLALEIQAYRQYQSGADKSNANYGDAFYYTTNIEGYITYFGFLGGHPEFGTSAGGRQNHSEQKILTQFVNNQLPNQILGKQLCSCDTLHVVLFTQLAPCTEGGDASCMSVIDQRYKQILGMLPPFSGFELSVWTSRNQNDRGIAKYPGTVVTPFDVTNSYYRWGLNIP